MVKAKTTARQAFPFNGSDVYLVYTVAGYPAALIAVESGTPLWTYVDDRKAGVGWRRLRPMRSAGKPIEQYETCGRIRREIPEDEEDVQSAAALVASGSFAIYHPQHDMLLLAPAGRKVLRLFRYAKEMKHTVFNLESFGVDERQFWEELIWMPDPAKVLNPPPLPRPRVRLKPAAVRRLESGTLEE